jgi:hypothetical protein
VIAGTLNVIYGIGALDSASIFVNDTRFILDDLNTMGWVLIVLGVIELGGGFSLLAGNTYGRVIGIVGGSLGAIGALFSIGGANPRTGAPPRYERQAEAVGPVRSALLGRVTRGQGATTEAARGCRKAS